MGSIPVDDPNFNCLLGSYGIMVNYIVLKYRKQDMTCMGDLSGTLGICLSVLYITICVYTDAGVSLPLVLKETKL